MITVSCSNCHPDNPKFPRAGGREDLRPEPLKCRKAGLAKLLRRSHAGIQLTEHVEALEHVVFAHARLLGLEDIVSKRSDAPYWHGRCRHWLKGVR